MAGSSLRKFVYLSIAAAVATIAFKLAAYFLTGSVGILSDALESCVNLVAALIALIMITLAEKPADVKHAFGHEKAEYFSSAIEGGLIVVAAISIIWSAVPRLLHPQPLENVGTGLLVAVGASVINLAVALVLIRNGKKHQSITLEADGKHLMTDVITSVGVLVGVALVKLTDWLILDAIVAIGVALNIVWTGYQLMRRSGQGLLDAAIPENEKTRIEQLLDTYREQHVEYHSLMTRQSGSRKFISLHLLVPGAWNIQQGHDLAESVEHGIRELFPDTPTTVFTHLEPVEDPLSLADAGIDRDSSIF
ncbi:MAG TPA: cation diffusion facilitator family transporter [Bacteroidales bacterium]|nr:cation diffusion facilitator family transporter [Bacteroidales bacterium]HRZ20218.1 cation diffusion facilitator family transporter [Bacteroidales bacterium]